MHDLEKRLHRVFNLPNRRDKTVLLLTYFLDLLERKMGKKGQKI